MKKYIIAASITATIVSIFYMLSNQVNAVSASDWKAGRIIDDVVFTNKDAMSIGEIQSFLNSKVGTGTNGTPGKCDTYGTAVSELGGGTRAQYAANTSLHPIQGAFYPPFTCLKDYYEVLKTSPSPTIPANNYDGKPIPAGAKSAAEIIWGAAQQYNISPKVLLVKLGTESAGPLTSDDWPAFNQYLYAMGSHCPDSGPGGSANCDTDYAGFSIQMYSAASLLRWYLDNMNESWWPYKKPNQVNNILWNVSETGCGGSDVFIENNATAALYTYTPYQPNQAALNNMYGSGDGCSAYGNRNFWRTYNDWFGTTNAPSYSWQFQGQYAYTNETKDVAVNLSTLRPGQRILIGFLAKNTGNQVWTNTGNNPVRVGSARPYNRSSVLYDSSWIAYGRPTNLKEASVAPGQIGTFEFWITTPQVTQPTVYKEYFVPLIEGLTWMEDWGMHFGLQISPPNYSWQITNQVTYTDDTMTTVSSLDQLNPQDKRYIHLTVKNTGDVTWYNSGSNPVALGTTNALDRKSAFADDSWINPSRPARMKESSVAPGQTATFDFWMKSPIVTSATDYIESFDLVAEGQAWMKDIGYNYHLRVNPAIYTWQLVAQAAYVDDLKTTPTGLDQMYPSQRKFISLIIKNSGNVTWYNSGAHPMDLGTTRTTDRLSQFFDSSWIGQSRPARMKESSVAPGQTATFDFWMKSPILSSDTDFLEYFTPVVEGVTWLKDIGLNYRIHAIKASYTWNLESLYAYSDASKSVPIGLGGLKSGQRVFIGFSAKNTGTVTWVNSGDFPIRVGTSRQNDHKSILCDISWISCTRPAAMKESLVAPGQTGTFEFWISAPLDNGISKEYFNLLSEQRSWFNDFGLNFNYSVDN